MKKTILISIIILLSTPIFAQKTGCISGDCENGYGKYVWTSGNEYIGYWVDNKQDGQGTFKFANGCKYVGQFAKGVREGSGTYTWDDGQKYTGEWMNDKQNGEGTHYYVDRTTKTGIWKDGEYQGTTNSVTGCISGDCSNGYGTYVFKGGEKYVGNWKLDKRNGQGTNYFESGESYTGEWKDDKRNGYGTNNYNDGTTKTGLWEEGKYIGSGSNNYGCISGDCDEGYGIYTWDTGERYEGNWSGGKRNGKGLNIFPSGSKYDGNWVDDKRDGYGFYQYKPGVAFVSYRGDWIMENFTGNGTLIYTNGNKYVGEFKDNYFDGEGTLTYTDGTVESGTWEKDVYQGKSNITSTGCISGNCDNGFGTYVGESGDKYIGYFKAGQREGQGTYSFAEGDVYDGDFKAGGYSGQGTYTFIDGRKYVGEWANSTYNGIGTLYYTDGTIQSGQWKDGQFIGENKKVEAPVITWLTPEYKTSESQTSEIKVKICIKSKGELSNVQIFVNNELKVNNATRGYSVVNSSCDFTIERDVPLVDGKNEIRVEVENIGGKSNSETRIVNKKVTQNNIVSNQKRFALVIGNGSYPTAPLKNPTNDAKVIAAELKVLGFEVFSYTDLTQAEMIKNIRAFGNKLSTEKGVGLFYYAGHGIQLNGENYIVPVNAVIEKEQDVELETVNLRRILGEMDYAQNDLNIIILDACRNNPFARSFRSGGGSGLATTTAPKGTFIAYATAPGSVASDGTGNNGLYTEELVKALRKPGLTIENVFKAVRVNVYDISNKQQVPWENSSIFGDFYFKQ